VNICAPLSLSEQSSKHISHLPPPLPFSDKNLKYPKISLIFSPQVVHIIPQAEDRAMLEGMLEDVSRVYLAFALKAGDFLARSKNTYFSSVNPIFMK
jgi:hypothetical protein